MIQPPPTQTDTRARRQELETLLSLFLEIENTMRAEGEADFADLHRQRWLCKSELARLDAPETSGDLGGLDELVAEHTRRLFKTLARPHTLEEIEAEAAALDDLLQAYRHSDALLEKLLDWLTPEYERVSVREQLRELNIQVNRERAETARLHEHAHLLIQRVALLVLKAQQEVENLTRRQEGPHNDG